jgi:hypothetical protein
MSQENVEIIRRVYDALNRNDWDAAFRKRSPGYRDHVQAWTPRGSASGSGEAASDCCRHARSI